MLQDFYINNKPLIEPPQTINQMFEETLRANDFDKDLVLKLDHVPEFQMIELEGLSSMHLDRDKTFQMLKAQIATWNGKIMDLRLGKIKNIADGPFQNHLFTALKKSLTTIASTRNREQQIRFTQKVKDWYYQQLSAQEKQKVDEFDMVHDDLLKFQDKDLPETAYQSSLQDFHSKYRSTHDHLDPPEDRVKTYQRRNLISAQSTATRPGTTQTTFKPQSQQQSRPKTSQTYKIAEQIVRRPHTNQQQTRKQQQQQSQKQQSQSQQVPWYQKQFAQQEDENIDDDDENDEENENENQDEVEGEREDEREDVVEQSPQMEQNPQMEQSPQLQSPLVKQMKKKKKKKKEQSIAPRIKSYVSDAQVQGMYEERDGRKVPQSTFLQHEQEDLDHVASINRIYHEKRNRELKDQREDEEMTKRIEEWTRNKGRVDEMIMQKYQSTQDGSKFNQVGIKMSEIFTEKEQHKRDDKFIMDKKEEDEYQKYLETSSKPQYTLQYKRQVQSTKKLSTSHVLDYTSQQHHKVGIDEYQFQVRINANHQQEQAVDLEQRIKEANFQKLKAIRGNWLPGGASIQTQESVPELAKRKLQSASSYSQQRNTKFANRTFSGIFRKSSQKQLQQDQLQEIQKVKSALIRIEKKVPIDVLKKSLMIPQGLQNPQGIELPAPGAGLFQEPDNGKGKEKKKGKKAKR